MKFEDQERVIPAAGKLPESPNCELTDYAAIRPGQCPNETRLILKPERVTRCGTGGLIKFETFTSSYNTEARHASGMTYESSDPAVVTVNDGGIATIIGPGMATISVTVGSLHAHARVQILQGDECCDDLTVLTALAFDNSRSMGQPFGQDYPTKLYVAKELARRYAAATNLEKDRLSVSTFDDVRQYLLPPSDVSTTIGQAIESVEGRNNWTDIRKAVRDALDLLETAEFDRKVLLIFSDGEARPMMTVQDYEAMQCEIQAFKDGGGIVIACGIRAKADGYVLMRNISSAGFFLNVFGDDSMQQGIDFILASMGYFCAADPLSGGYGYGYLDTAQLPDPDPMVESELFESSAG